MSKYNTIWYNKDREGEYHGGKGLCHQEARRLALDPGAVLSRLCASACVRFKFGV